MKISFLTLVSILLLIQNVISESEDENDGNSLGGPTSKNKFKCGRFEKSKKCGCSCREKCEHRLDPNACPKEKKVKGCFCLLGFYRNSKGNCVPADQCDGSHPNEDSSPMRGHNKNGNKYSTFPPIINTDEPSGSSINNRVKRDTKDKPQAQPVAPPNDNSPPEGIVQGGLPPEDLAQLSDEDSTPTESNPGTPVESNSGTPTESNPGIPASPLRQGGLREADLEEAPEEEDEPWYPEDEDCGPNEKYTECGLKCRESLGFVKKKKTCPQSCERGCFCKKGYFRDGFSNCNQVPDKYLHDIIGGHTKKADPVKCVRDNERYDDCGDRCVESLANLNNVTKCRPYQCVRGCYCADNFLRDKEGMCVPAQRPKIDEDDEDDDDEDDDKEEKKREKGNGSSNRKGGGGDRRVERIDRDEQMQGKRHQPHQDRQERGRGGPQNSRPNCPRNQVFSKCGNRCMESLDTLKDRSVCDPKWCDIGCFCAPGLYRNRRGSCIRGPTHNRGHPSRHFQQNECPRKETFSDCGNRCMEAMDNHMNPKNCDPYHCDRGCFCKPGLFRNRNGDCINPLRPPPQQKRRHCPKHEGFSECGNRCMESLENKLIGRRECDPNQCDTGCFCLPELFRDRNGQCRELPSPARPVPLCKMNEKFAQCGSDCGQTCADLLRGSDSICTRNCWQGCFCKRGYFKDENLDCVLPTKCQNTEETKGEITFIVEPGESESQNETDYEPDYEYTPDLEPDYKLENQTTNGLNIKCKLNEHYSDCGSVCGQSCQLITDKDRQESCPPECKPGCYCDEGLLRNEDGVCVLEAQCNCKLAAKMCENPNEDYFWCFNECGRTCFDFKQGSDAECPGNCSRGCFCKNGFVRNENGQCVREEECVLTKSEIRCNKNEVFSDCGSECGRNCIELNKSPEDLQCFSCESGCFCEKGYYRSDEGICVAKSECALNVNIGRTDCEDNEEFTECGNFCADNCQNNQSLVQIENCPLICQKGCICSQGFKRNLNGICIPITECNDLKPICKQNEEYTDCGSKCGQQCNDIIRKNLQCPLVCEKGCFCKRGYYSDQNGVCIAKNECEVDPFECPYSEQYRKCGTRCGESCEDLKNPVNCPEECEEGCFCQNGLFRDIEGVCVNKTECDLDPTQMSIPDCPSNQVFKECGNKCDESCEDRVGCNSDCEKGCFCDEGYLRHITGKCVADDQCKALEQCVECQPNEYYTDCGSDCGKFCSDLRTYVKCEKSCRKGCFCKYGFHRNELGQCVSRDKCS